MRSPVQFQSPISLSRCLIPPPTLACRVAVSGGVSNVDADAVLIVELPIDATFSLFSVRQRGTTDAADFREGVGGRQLVAKDID